MLSYARAECWEPFYEVRYLKRLIAFSLGALALVLTGCGDNNNQTSNSGNILTNVTTVAAPAWKCTTSTPQLKCPAEWFTYQKARVLIDFNAATDLENSVSQAFNGEDPNIGARLENDVAERTHHSEPPWLFEQDQLRGAGVSFLESDTLSECINAIDTMQGLAVDASEHKTAENLASAEKDRREYVMEARKCERGFHLEPTSGTLRSRQIAPLDDTAPST